MTKRVAICCLTAVVLTIATVFCAPAGAATITMTLTPVKGAAITDGLKNFSYQTAQNGMGGSNGGHSNGGNYGASVYKPVDPISNTLMTAAINGTPFKELRIDLTKGSSDGFKSSVSVCFYDVLISGIHGDQSFQNDIFLNERVDFAYVQMTVGGSGGCKSQSSGVVPALGASLLRKSSTGVTVGATCFAGFCRDKLEITGGTSACAARAVSCHVLGDASVALSAGAHRRVFVPVDPDSRWLFKRIHKSALNLLDVSGGRRFLLESPAILNLPGDPPRSSASLSCPASAGQGGSIALSGSLLPAIQAPAMIEQTAPDGGVSTIVVTSAADGSIGVSLPAVQAGTYKFTVGWPGGANGHWTSSSSCETVVSPPPPPVLTMTCPTLIGNNAPIPSTVPFSGNLAPDLGGSVTVSFTHNSVLDHQDTVALDAAGNWIDLLSLTNTIAQQGSWSAVATYPAGSSSPSATSGVCGFTAG